MEEFWNFFLFFRRPLFLFLSPHPFTIFTLDLPYRVYDLIRLCKFSTISLKEASLDIISSTFLIEWRTVE